MPPEQLAPPDYLRRLEGLSLLARQLARGPQRSERKSALRGVSPEFTEYRAYIPGDDIRYIDWNAYARSRHLVLKLFVEERDLPVYILLDCTASMRWGDPDKFFYARQLALGLCYITLSNQDRAGIYAVGRVDNISLDANRGKQRFWQAVKLLSNYSVETESVSLYDDLSKWMANAHRRGFVIWISDFWGSDTQDAFRAIDRLRHSRHETALIQVMDESETSAGAFGEYILQAAEHTGGDAGRRPALVDSYVKREYKRNFQSYQTRLDNYCRQHQIPFARTFTSLPVHEFLRSILRASGFVSG